MIQFCLRLGDKPQACITTTPRNNPALRALLNRPSTVKTHAPTSANRANLADDFLEEIEARYAGTRLGRQEMDGELLTDVAGAAPVEDHQHMAEKLVQNAQTADKYCKKTGRAHPIWGVGSLADACIGQIKAPPLTGCDANYLACLSTLVAVLRMK